MSKRVSKIFAWSTIVGCVVFCAVVTMYVRWLHADPPVVSDFTQYGPYNYIISKTQWTDLTFASGKMDLKPTTDWDNNLDGDGGYTYDIIISIQDVVTGTVLAYCKIGTYQNGTEGVQGDYVTFYDSLNCGYANEYDNEDGEVAQGEPWWKGVIKNINGKALTHLDLDDDPEECDRVLAAGCYLVDPNSMMGPPESEQVFVETFSVAHDEECQWTDVDNHDCEDIVLHESPEHSHDP